MAETFLAVQRGAAGFEQRVCMKFILPAHRQNPDFRRLFLREASIAASLRHSNIVGVIDVDEAAGYLVLELVDGVDLRAVLNAVPQHRIAVELATFITIELCKALAYAHGRKRNGMPDGVVHRDVSASNVLISYAGEVKLTDFGVARAMRAEAEPLSTTVKGKLCYMSPEQARGVVVDGRSDLFSLGVLFYELLAGQRPFDGATDAETLLRIAAGQHRPLLDLAPDVPAGLATVVERLLARDRDQRFMSADACIDALARFAPKATAFRELGDLARATRPHQTLPSYDVIALDHTAPSAPEGRRALDTQQLPDVDRMSLRTSPGFGKSSLRHTATLSASGAMQALRRVNGSAWSALGIALLGLLAVASAWTARLANEHGAIGTQDSFDHPLPSTPVRPSTETRIEAASNPPLQPPPTAAPVPAAPSGTNAGTSAAVAMSAPISTNVDLPSTPPAAIEAVEQPLAEGNAPKRGDPGFARDAGDDVVGSGRSTSGRRTAARAPDPRQHAEAGEAMLHIGVIPMGQVWVDGRLSGWTPVDVKVGAGQHRVSAGATRPEVHQTLRLKPGESRQLVLNLEQSQPELPTTSRLDGR